ncbi:hypothetical protein N7E70_011275 [Aminobacter sp. NyZ550]|uniref:hypothetical protein n=1 Tax=Aminobacter sp. NyZ550 TaxID=2979870 RepID=UPI0021D59E27|nr:hypothetical protein [Aminobacter sp. NyZ550]WAX97386.1 hypothetical protein N7E70_011275 [Aminobacter sp. NyZ550]
MTGRTKRSTVHFDRPFPLRGIEEIQPAGDYDIDQDEELIDGISWIAYRRVATYIHLPARSSNLLTSQVLAIDYAELEAALRQDQEKAA